MAHRATVYSVRVHKRNHPTEFLPLGALDEKARYLGDFLKDVLNPKTFSAPDDLDEREAICEHRKFAEGNDSDLQAIFFAGERGVRANIVGKDGQTRLQQMPSDTQMLRCGSLFRLPKTETVGWWACHVNAGRGIKTLVAPILIERFAKEFPELILTIDPVINEKAFATALEEGKLLSATLSKYEKSSDIADGDKWSAKDTGLKFDLSIKPDRGKRLPSLLAFKAFKNDKAALKNVVEFRGFGFDSASFEVELADGIKRSYNTARPEGGHPFSQFIEPALEQDGNPQDASLFTELAGVIAELG